MLNGDKGMVSVKEENQVTGFQMDFLLHLAFVRYLIAGLGSFVADFSVFTILTVLGSVDPLIANLISRPLGGATCFILNRNWTFHAGGSSPLSIQFIRFWIVFGTSLALTEGLLALFCKVMELPAVPGKALAESLVFVFNFLALKHWTFQCSPRR